MSKYSEFDLDLSVGSNNNTETRGVSGSIVSAVTTYITNSVINGNCKTVTDECKCEGTSISTPCSSAGYRIR